jgi:drug/metabolite transporter (DMT)-like permease
MKLKGFLSLLTVGILFGLSGPLAKLLSDSFSAYETVFVRFSVAFIVAILVSILIKNKVSFAKVPKSNLILFSITFPVSVIFFVLSVYNTKVALAIFTYYIADSLTSYALGYLFLKEKIDAFRVVCLILVFISLIFFTNIFSVFTLDTGMIFGLLSGFINGIASYYKKVIKGQSNVMSLTLLQTFSGGLVAFIAIILSGEFFIKELLA